MWGNPVFANSLIIYDENTKEITSVIEVLIACPNLHRFWRFYYSFVLSAFNDHFEKLYQNVTVSVGTQLILAGSVFVTSFLQTIVFIHVEVT